MGAWWCVAALAVRNVAGLALPGVTYVPVNVAVGLGLVAGARRHGVSWGEMGLARRHLRRAIRTGAILGAAAAAVMVTGAALPATRGFYDDERVVTEGGTAELAYQTIVRIPVGTVAFEELAFRGVLLGLLRRRLGVGRAVAIDSGLFGLWHVVPTLSTASVNGIDGVRAAALVTGSVVATAAGGVLFCLLRLRTGHVAAPALLHLAFNDTGYVLSWSVRT